MQWEAALIREEVYANREAALDRIVPVVLPGCSATDIPSWLGPTTSTHYAVADYTVTDADRLLRLLTSQPYETEPPLGTQPDLPPREAPTAPKRTGLRTELLIHATGDDAELAVEVTLAGTPLGHRRSTLPPELRTVWQSRDAGPLVAAGRMLTAGRQLAAAVFDDRSRQLLADLLDQLPPGDWVDVVWVGEGTASTLPVELLRLTTGTGHDLGPLALRAGVTVIRCKLSWTRWPTSPLTPHGHAVSTLGHLRRSRTRPRRGRRCRLATATPPAIPGSSSCRRSTQCRASGC